MKTVRIASTRLLALSALCALAACDSNNTAGDLVDSGSTDIDASPIGDCQESAQLANLVLSANDQLRYDFSPDELSYQLDVSVLIAEVRVSASSQDERATIRVNNVELENGVLSSPIALNLGVNAVSVQVSTEDASCDYVAEINRGAKVIRQVAYAKASNTQDADQFGFSLALSGDTMAVSARVEDSNANGVNGDETDNSALSSGAVYVFRYTGTIWVQEAYLKASNTETEDGFGFSLALSGDTLAVGAEGEDSNAVGVNGDQNDNSATGSGAAYIFHRNGSNWIQEAYIKASNTGNLDHFGFELDLSGDILAVGAYGEQSNSTGINSTGDNDLANRSGAVYVFKKKEGQWEQDAYIKPFNTGAGDRFGWSLALTGDSQSGALLAVGAHLEESNATGIGENGADNSARGSGAVYVFRSNSSKWQQEAYIKAPNSEASDEFGYSVAISGNRLAVGARYEDSGSFGIGGLQSDNSSPDSGAAYTYVHDGTSWQEEAYIKSSNASPSDEFGHTLALSESILAIGAYREDSGTAGIDGNENDDDSPDTGAVYVFGQSGESWSQTHYLKASNAGIGDLFSFSLAISGDSLAVGSIVEDSNAKGINGNENDEMANGSGAAYLFQ